jgi:hypothetical protein
MEYNLPREGGTTTTTTTKKKRRRRNNSKKRRRRNSFCVVKRVPVRLPLKRTEYTHMRGRERGK